MYEPKTPSEKRLQGALVFSLVVTPAFIVASLLLRHPARDDRSGLMLVWAGAALAMASLFSTVVLVAALVERRPAWADPVGRWAWAWALVSCAALGYLGLTGIESETVGSLATYASGMFAIAFGGVGLFIAALPPWHRSDS